MPSPARRWLLAAALAGVGGCGPRLSDKPDAFFGDGNLAVAVLCSSAELERGEPEGMWVKVIVRAQSGVGVNWDDIVVRARGVEVTKAAVGRVTKQPGGVQQRISTYWVTAKPEPEGGEVRAGPVEVVYRVPPAKPVKITSQACPLSLVDG
ncbi:MAG: hypothetical protein JNM72_14570 [Deltaproteobacteria bacterium]|nr:hypothetical protein [Deltaproteobacteria bacterium]